jgi:hypothetical protein
VTHRGGAPPWKVPRGEAGDVAKGVCGPEELPTQLRPARQRRCKLPRRRGGAGGALRVGDSRPRALPAGERGVALGQAARASSNWTLTPGCVCEISCSQGPGAPGARLIEDDVAPRPARANSPGGGGGRRRGSVSVW